VHEETQRPCVRAVCVGEEGRKGGCCSEFTLQTHVNSPTWSPGRHAVGSGTAAATLAAASSSEKLMTLEALRTCMLVARVRAREGLQKKECVAHLQAEGLGNIVGALHKRIG
jgi:hypothetical protein